MKRVFGIVGVPGTMTKIGLTLNKGLSFVDWLSVGKDLRNIHRFSLWWLGDWLNYGERKYGETYTQAIEETDYDYGTLRNCAWVCDQIELPRRRDTLSFSSHQEIAPMEPKEQDRWLDLAEQNEWGRKELRAAIREERQEKTKLPAESKLPSFEDLFRIIQGICYREDLKNGRGRGMVRDFLNDAVINCGKELKPTPQELVDRWNSLKTKYEIADR